VVRAVELYRESCTDTGSALVGLLTSRGLSNAQAASLRDTWLHHGNFLLADLPTSFDYVVAPLTSARDSSRMPCYGNTNAATPPSMTGRTSTRGRICRHWAAC